MIKEHTDKWTRENTSAQQGREQTDRDNSALEQLPRDGEDLMPIKVYGAITDISTALGEVERMYSIVQFKGRFEIWDVNAVSVAGRHKTIDNAVRALNKVRPALLWQRNGGFRK